VGHNLLPLDRMTLGATSPLHRSLQYLERSIR